MWYWIRKVEGALFLLLFIPYYKLRRIPVYLRCRQCGRMVFDQMYAPNGLCEHCDRARALNDSQALYEETYAQMPTDAQRGNHYNRIAARVGLGKVLDVGCGQGTVLSLLRSEERELYGVDISNVAIKQAANAASEAHLLAADAACLPFVNDTFDSLVCSEVLEHIPTNAVAQECLRILKPNGTAVFTVPSGEGPIGRYYSCHVQFFSWGSIRGLLEGVGFQVTGGERFGLYVPVVSRMFNLLSRLLGRPLPFSPILNIRAPEFLASNFLIVCRKPAMPRE